MGKRRGRIEQSRGGGGGEEEDENYIAYAEVNERNFQNINYAHRSLHACAF